MAVSQRLVLGHPIKVERLHALQLVGRVAGESLRRGLRGEDVSACSKEFKRRVPVDVLRFTEPEQADDVWVALEQESHGFLEAVEHDVEFVDLDRPVLPPREAQMELERRDDESHEVDVVDGVRILRR
jgi:hypothetical protein